MVMKTKIDIAITTVCVFGMAYFAGAIWWEIRRGR
jgi:hypothetical protein